jgi:predicted kinase
MPSARREPDTGSSTVERMGTPSLVVVSGPPGAGKTTLAHRLAATLGCPAVCRDEIKEGMVHASPGFVPSPGDPLTMRTLEAFFAVLRLLLESQVSVVAEAAFQDPIWRPRLAPLARLADLRVIYCVVDLEVARDRQQQRSRDVATRAAHADTAHLAGSAGQSRFAYPALGAPTLHVDTTTGYRPGLSEIAGFVNAGRANVVG